jgi:hypothetical protein
MNFIFQAKPDTFDQRTMAGAEPTHAWLASRYRQEMHKGDVVYLWRAGEPSQRGIYGWGEITSEGAFVDARDAAYRVQVTYKKLFRNHQLKPPFINFEALQQDPVLRETLVLRAPMGTNFPLTVNESEAIRKLVRDIYGTQWAPSI